jgi:hypothetical protein
LCSVDLHGGIMKITTLGMKKYTFDGLEIYSNFEGKKKDVEGVLLRVAAVALATTILASAFMTFYLYKLINNPLA